MKQPALLLMSHVADGAKSPSGHSLALARQGLDFPAPAAEKQFANLGQTSPLTSPEPLCVPAE
jgi:hypothetical protein